MTFCIFKVTLNSMLDKEKDSCVVEFSILIFEFVGILVVVRTLSEKIIVLIEYINSIVDI